MGFCQKHNLQYQLTASCPECDPVVSVADETMDSLVQAASVPNLADLFRKAKASGAIAPMAAYGEGATSS